MLRRLFTMRSNADSRDRLVDALARAGRNDDRIVVLEQALRRSSDDERVALARTIARIWDDEIGNRQEAVDAWKRLLRFAPDDADALRRMKGIGPYTAGAILAFAYRRDAAIVDTNVKRVLGRVFLGPRRTARLRGQKAWWDLARAVLPARRVYDHNQALMDFGATWCTPRAPRCNACPMTRFCASYPLAPPARRRGGR